MSRGGELVRAAFTQTVNAFPDMPGSVEELPQLVGRLAEVREANVAHHEALIRRAAAAGARLACLGELFTTPYFACTEHPMWLDLAEDADTGPTVSRLSKVAAELRVVIIAPLYEYSEARDQRFNTATVIDADGRVLGKYRKNHIPCGDNERGTFRETFYYRPSDGWMRNPRETTVLRSRRFPVFKTAVGRVGVAICYDRHFEGVVRTLARSGAQLVVFPSTTFGAKSERMWEMEFEVDALRHGIYVGGSNRLGVEEPWGTEYFGRSYFVGPNGRCPNLADEPELVIADLDFGALDAPDPAGWNLKADFRDDIYT